MGFFDNAKKKILDIAKRSGEETIGTSIQEEAQSPNHQENFQDEKNFTAEDFLDKDLFGHEEAAKSRNVSDILALLQIEEAVKLPNDIMIPSDYKRPKFSKSTPVGYDIAEVDSFISQAKASSEKLIALHDERNKDIVKLAEYSDQLKAENQNLIYQAELAQGISILPTESQADAELAEAQMTIMRLKAELQKRSALPQDDSLSTNDRISILEREKEELEWENRDLKNQIIALRNDLVDSSAYEKSTVENIDDSEDYFNEEFFASTRHPSTDYNESILPAALPPITELSEPEEML